MAISTKVFRFRPKREDFDESMREVQSFTTGYAFVAYLNRTFGTKVMLSELLVAEDCFDERNGWESHSVALPGIGIVGFTDGPVPRQ